MSTYYNAFTHDDFESSIEHDEFPAVAHKTAALPIAIIMHDSVAASEKPSIEVGQNVHRESFVDTMPYGGSNSANAISEEVTIPETELKNHDQQIVAETNAFIPQVSVPEIEDIELETKLDPVCAPTFNEGSKVTANDPVDVAFENDDLAPGTMCASPPRRPMRPSRGIHPIERRRALTIQPSRDVPLTGQTFALSVVVEAASDPQAVLVNAIESSMSEPSSDSHAPPSQKSRKRTAAEKVAETANRARQNEEVSQNLRPRRSTGSSIEEAYYFLNNYESVQLKCDDLQGDIDDLEIQLRRDVKALQRRFRKETLEAEDWFRKTQRGISDAIQMKVCDMQANFQLESKALREQLDNFKIVLKEGGLLDLDG